MHGTLNLSSDLANLISIRKETVALDVINLIVHLVRPRARQNAFLVVVAFLFLPTLLAALHATACSLVTQLEVADPS